MEQAPGASPPARCQCSPVFEGGKLIPAHLACCTPERSGPQEPEKVFAQVLAAAGRLAWMEMVRTEGRQAGMGQAAAAAASLSMFPNRNVSIKPHAALPRALEVCSKSTSRFQIGHIEHPPRLRVCRPGSLRPDQSHSLGTAYSLSSLGTSGVSLKCLPKKGSP